MRVKYREEEKIMSKKAVSFAVLIAMLISVLPVLPAGAAASIDGWSTYFSNVTDGEEATITLDTTEKASGTASVNATFSHAYESMYYASVSQRVPVEQGHRYYYGLKVKTEKAHNITLKIDQTNVDSLVPFSETSDWKTYTFSYEHKTDAADVNFAIIIEGKTENVWFDDAFFYDADDSEKTNMMKNPSFDGSGAGGSAGENTENPAGESTAVSETEALYNKLRESDSFSYSDIASVMGGFHYGAAYPAENITIDGDAGDWDNYDAMHMPVRPDQSYLLDESVLVGEMDMTVDYKMSYDDENFYILLNVHDKDHVFFNNSNDYWRGDSVQLALCSVGKSYEHELSFVCDTDNNTSGVYSSTYSDSSPQKVDLATSRSGEITTYEAAIPWDILFEEIPEKCLMCFAVNDNDGPGRAYFVQLDNGGITLGTKSSADFPAIEFLDADKDWYSWIEGAAEINTGDAGEYSVYIVNKGDEKTVNIDIPLFNVNETVTIPAQSGIRREYSYSSETYGNHTVECTVTEGENKGVSTFDFYVNPSEGYFDETIEEMRYKGKELSNLVRRCKEAGMTPDYAEMRSNIYNQYIDFFEDDLSHHEYYRIDHNLKSLEEIYEKTKEELNSYLSGKKTPLEVPKYVGDMQVEGSHTTALAEYNGEITRRNMFFSGFNCWGMEEHLPFLTSIGFNHAQLETGISSTVALVEEGGINGWFDVSWDAMGVPDFEITLDTEEKASGERSFKMVYSSPWENNVYRKVYQAITCKPNTTYRWGFKAKAENAGDVHASITNGNPYNERVIMPTGTYDWTNFDYEYTTGDDTTLLTFTFFFMSNTDAMWLDDLYVYEGDSDENLVKNGGFEEEADASRLTQFDAQAFSQHITSLENAKQNGICVDLLISPHYFLNKLFELYPDLEHPNGLMAKYRLDHPIAIKVTEEYIHDLMQAIKPYEDIIGSICLCNEPSHLTQQSEDYYKPKWTAFLAETYNNDIGELNKNYGTSYTSFDEVPMVSSSAPSVPLYDYITFNDTISTNWIKMLADNVRKYTDIPVHEKVMHWMASEDSDKEGKRWLILSGCDPEKLVDYMDINGNDSELSITVPVEENIEGKMMQKAFNYDFSRSFNDAPVYNSEDHVGLNGEMHYGPEFAQNVRLEQWMSALHGRSITSLWNFDRSRSRDWTAEGMAFRPDELETIATINMDLNRLADYAYAVVDKPADVGLLMSKTTRIYRIDHVNGLYKAYENLLYNGIKPLFAVESRTDLFDTFDTIYMPNVSNVEVDTLYALKDFVDNGGRLIMLGDDQLLGDTHNQPLPQDVVEYVKSKAEHYTYEVSGANVSTPDDEIYKIMNETTAEKQRVKLIDTETGEPVRDVEWQAAEFDDINGESGTVINIGNNNWTESRSVQLYIDGELIENPFELRSNETLETTFTLEPCTPILVKVTK